MENAVIFYDHLEYFTAMWYNLGPFGIVCGNLVYFYVWTKKNLATLAYFGSFDSVGKSCNYPNVKNALILYFKLNDPSKCSHSFRVNVFYRQGDQIGRIVAYWFRVL
jgi:hypothetical protein